MLFRSPSRGECSIRISARREAGDVIFTVEDDGHVKSISYYRNGGRAYTGSGVYQVLTEICKAARECAQRCECGKVSC